jgi:ribosome-associated toxin RatA of RatAB toxin-antitoxin module
MPYLLFLLMFTSINAYSAFDTFICTIKQSKFVSENGLLIDQPKYKHLIDQEFNVDKNTGAISGVFTTDNFKEQPSIVDYGSNNQPFKVIIAHYPKTTVDLLLIQEYSINKQKPFTFITNQSIFTGLCITQE